MTANRQLIITRGTIPPNHLRSFATVMGREHPIVVAEAELLVAPKGTRDAQGDRALPPQQFDSKGLSAAVRHITKLGCSRAASIDLITAPDAEDTSGIAEAVAHSLPKSRPVLRGGVQLPIHKDFFDWRYRPYARGTTPASVSTPVNRAGEYQHVTFGWPVMATIARVEHVPHPPLSAEPTETERLATYRWIYKPAMPPEIRVTYDALTAREAAAVRRVDDFLGPLGAYDEASEPFLRAKAELYNQLG